MNFHIFLQIFKSRLWLIIFILAITVATTAVVTMLLPKKYTASTSMALTLQDTSPIDQVSASSQLAQMQPIYMATQKDIITSRNVALKVVNYLKLADSVAARQAFMDETQGQGDIRIWLADNLLQYLSVDPSRDSMVLNVSYTSTDPQEAAKVANAFAQAYIDVNLELSMEPARRNAAWLDGQLKSLRDRLEDEQKRLTAYQQQNGIVATDEKLDTETRRLEDLTSSLVKAQADAYDVKSRQLGTQHPDYKHAIEQESALAKSLEDQKRKILELKKQRDEIDLMTREIENTSTTYDAGLKHFYQTSLESQFNQTNISLLDKAVPPITASSPILLLNLALSVFLGLIFGLGLALMLEVFGRRIRVEKDITDGMGLPVLASL